MTTFRSLFTCAKRRTWRPRKSSLMIAFGARRQFSELVGSLVNEWIEILTQKPSRQVPIHSPLWSAVKPLSRRTQHFSREVSALPKDAKRLQNVF